MMDRESRHGLTIEGEVRSRTRRLRRSDGSDRSCAPRRGTEQAYRP